MKTLLHALKKAPQNKPWIVTRRALGGDRKQEDRWHSFSYGEIQEASSRLAAWLQRERQICSGDIVAILSENRVDSLVVILASHMIGAIAYPIYPTYSSEQVLDVLNRFGVRLLFVSDAHQSKKAESFQDRVVFESDEFREAVRRTEPLEPEDGNSLKEMDPGYIVATSGTTGEPKGALLPHYGIYVAGERIMGWGSQTGKDRGLSILPFCHVAGLNEVALSLVASSELWIVETKEELIRAIPSARPTHLICVPNLFEKLRRGILDKLESRPPLAKRIFKWGFNMGERRLKRKSRLLDYVLRPLAHLLVYRSVRKGLGGAMRKLYTGGAPLSVKTFDFFWSLGIPILEGYGMTETSAVVCANSLQASSRDTVGLPAEKSSIRIAGDGEIQIKDRTSALRYVNSPLPLTSDGYYSTGDLGAFTEDGFLKITGRKKELIVLDTGENVAPLKVEASLKRSPLIEEAVAMGNRRKFIAVAIVPVKEASEKELYGELERCSSGLALFERPKKHFLLPEIPPEVLTPSMKIRREVFERYFHEQIEQVYGAERVQVSGRENRS